MSATPTVRADPGLQPERTSLSWVRCASALAALAVLYARCVPGFAAVAVGGVMLACAGVLLVSARTRHHAVCAEFGRGYARPQWGWNLLLLATVLGSAVVAAVTVLDAAS